MWLFECTEHAQHVLESLAREEAPFRICFGLSKCKVLLLGWRQSHERLFPFSEQLFVEEW